MTRQLARFSDCGWAAELGFSDRDGCITEADLRDKNHQIASDVGYAQRERVGVSCQCRVCTGQCRKTEESESTCCLQSAWLEPGLLDVTDTKSAMLAITRQQRMHWQHFERGRKSCVG